MELQVLKLTIRAMTVKTTAEKRIHNLEKEKTESVEKTANFDCVFSILKCHGQFSNAIKRDLKT